MFFQIFWSQIVSITPNHILLSHVLDCYRKLENAFNRFAKNIFIKENGKKDCRTFNPRYFETNKLSSSQKSSHSCRNIICKVPKFIFGTRWTKNGLNHALYWFQSHQLYWIKIWFADLTYLLSPYMFNLLKKQKYAALKVKKKPIFQLTQLQRQTFK